MSTKSTVYAPAPAPDPKASPAILLAWLTQEHRKLQVAFVAVNARLQTLETPAAPSSS